MDPIASINNFLSLKGLSFAQVKLLVAEISGRSLYFLTAEGKLRSL
jgi:hypothetical protein